MNHRYKGWRDGLLLLLLIAAALPVSAVTVRAQLATEILVNSTTDLVDADLVDNICDADPGPAVQCTLRAAIMQTNVTPGQFVIRLQAQIYRLTITGTGEELGLTGDLDIRGKVEIVGTTAGRAQTTIDASAISDRVLDIASSSVVLRNLTVTGGKLPSTTETSSAFNGGGIRLTGTALVSDSTIRNNTAARGGGIAVNIGTLTVERSMISNNSATGPNTTFVIDGGGGIFIQGSATIRDSTIQDNTSAFQGGGITALPSLNLPIEIQRSLIVSNVAQGRGGGISLEGINEGDFLLNNSTVSANRSNSGGGGIAAQNQVKPLVLTASTIAGNIAPTAGGVLLENIQATNVIFANNTLANCKFDSDGVAMGQFNLSSDGTCKFDTTSTNLKNVNAQLAPLAFNGGPTRTHALLQGSPAIDGGTFPVFAILLDQRGSLRIPPGRLPAPFGNPHDIGAFEFNAAGVGTFALNPVTTTITAGQPLTLTLTWTHPTRWRDLNQVDLQLRHAEELPLWVRFTEGITQTVGISTTNGLALYNSDGTLAGVGMPGETTVLESDCARLDLTQSRVQGSGPDGKEVTLTLAVQLKESSAGRIYTATLLANSDDGTQQGPNEAGTVTVGQFQLLLPLVMQS